MSPAHVAVIGAGGTGSWLAHALAKLLVDGDSLTLVDADVLEKRNLDRQLFDIDDIGRPKVTALAERVLPGARCQVYAENSWWEPGWEGESQVQPEDLLLESPTCLISAADNHNARREVLMSADRVKCPAIVCGNELVGADAYVYLPEWKGTKNDPRVYMPEILRINPRAQLTSCTGEAQAAEPQLATANMLSAAYAMFLYRAWLVERFERELSPEAVRRLPRRIVSTWGRVTQEGQE